MRNSTSTSLSLLEQTKCRKVFYSTELAHKVRALQVEMADLQTFNVPALDDMSNGSANPYPYEETFANARWNPVVIFQSSGSTGKSYTA